MTALSVEIGADVSRLQTGMAITKAELKDVSSEVKNLTSQWQDATEAVQDELLPQIEALVAKEAQLKAELAEANVKLKEHKEAAEGAGGAFATMRESVEGLNVKIAETKGIFTGLGELFLAGLGAEKIFETAHEVIELGDALHKASEETGISVQTLSALKVAADYADVQFDQLQRGVAKFSVNLQQAEAGIGKAAQIFGVLGISQKELAEHGNDTAYMLEEVAKKLDEYGNGANKEALVSELFGARLRDIQPILNDLAENGIQGMTDKARDMGVLFDGDFAASMKKAHDQGVELDEAIVHLTASMAPMIKAVAEATEWWAKLFSGASPEDLRAKITLVELSIDELEQKVKHESPLARLFSTDETDLEHFKANLEELKAELAAMPKLDASEAPEEQKPQAPALPNLAAQRQAAAEAKRLKEEEYQDEIATDQAEAAQYSSASSERIAILAKELETAKQFWGEGSRQYEAVLREMTTAQRQQTDQRLREGEQTMEAETAAFIKGKDAELAAFTQHEQELVSLNRLSADQAAAQEVRLTEEISAQELKRLDLAITMASDDLALHQKLADQRIALAQKEADQIQKITDKAADEEARKAIQTDQEIARSAGQTGSQLIFGKMTVAQAAEQYAELAVEKAIEWGFKEVLAHVGFEAQKVAATTAGEQAQVVAKVAGAEEAKGVEAAAGSVSVMGDAYKAAAGAYAALAGIPIIGPILAPVAAGVAFGAVAAFDVFSCRGRHGLCPLRWGDNQGARGGNGAASYNRRAPSRPPCQRIVRRRCQPADGSQPHPQLRHTVNAGMGSDPGQIKTAVVAAIKEAHRDGAFVGARRR